MSTPNNVEIAIIGGTGVYGVEGMQNAVELEVDTPFGKPSSKIRVGEVEGVRVAFLARHDTNHRLTPSEIPFQANIWALKSLGVKYLLTFGACGSLRENVKPLDVVLVDQYIDRTKTRPDTFFGNGIIAHVALGDPVCRIFKDLVKEVLQTIHFTEGTVIHDQGTYICMEGPGFSSKAESNMYRQWGGTVIGMTAVPEIKLAREAEMAFATIALVTDFDCWHPDHDHVTVDMVVKNLKINGIHAQQIVKAVVGKLAKNKFDSPAHDALKFAIFTPLDHISEENRTRLRPIIGKYLKDH